MTNADIDAAARYLVAARIARQPGERLPEAVRPNDIAGALAIQRRVGELLEVTIGGWKCSLPNAERAVALAPIFLTSIFRTAPCPILPIAGKARIEPEIAFVLSKSLPARAQAYSEAEVRSAVGETRMSIELIGTRYANTVGATYPEMLADNISNHGLFVGPVIDNASALALDKFRIVVSTPDAELLTRDGKHPDGHPFPPLVALANYLAAHGGGLEAGQIITTGSYCGVIDVPLETPLRFDYGDFATLLTSFTAPE